MDTDELEEALATLFAQVAASGDQRRDPRKPHVLMGFGRDSVSFVGEAVWSLDRVTGLVSGHALASGGPHPTVVRRWIAEACVQARTDLEGATRGFLARLEAPVHTWQVVAPYTDIRLPDGYQSLGVGACHVRRGAPPDIGLQALLSTESALSELAPAYEGMVLATEVAARDQASAEVVAIDRFETARAILAAANGAALRRTPDAILVRDDGGWGTAGGGALLLPWPALNAAGSPRDWSNGWHELSEAARTGATDEWPRRVLVAVRWLHRSSESWWTSERIVACFSALEALTLPAKLKKGDKRWKELSRTVTSLGVLSGRDAQWQQAWLEKLYGRGRTAAVHHGIPVDRDLDAERLESLTRHVVRWAVWHLSPFHRVPNGSCFAFNEVYDESAHAEPIPGSTAG